MFSQACPRISTKSLFRMHREFLRISRRRRPLHTFYSPRCVLRIFCLHPPSSEGMLLYDCVSYEALYAPSCAAPRDYELPQRCSRSSREEPRYRNNSVCQLARKYTQRLYDRGEIRFAAPFPPTTNVPSGIASKQYLATFREPDRLFGPFLRVDTI